MTLLWEAGYLTPADNEDVTKLSNASRHRGKKDPYRITLITRHGTTLEQVADLMRPLLLDGQIVTWQVEGPGARGVVAGGFPDD